MSAKKKNVFTWESDAVEVSWDGRLCIHVGECTRATGAVFESGREPWCAPAEGSADEVAEISRRCPTGALTWRRKDGGAEETAPGANRIAVANDGPLYATGDLRIEGAPGDMPGVRFRAALCRCGRSANKPFCDNAHVIAEFRDHGAIGETGPGIESEGGPLEIGRAPNGPLLVRGNLSLVSGSGRVAWRGTKAALCRCGQSANKPFCDGSHKGAKFEAP